MLQTRFTFPNPEGASRQGSPTFILAVRQNSPQGVYPARSNPHPAASRSTNANRIVVYVIDKDDKAELRPVQASLWYENEWLIDDGLQPGERVVVEGFHRVRPGFR